jgi:hypothetical protein
MNHGVDEKTHSQSQPQRGMREPCGEAVRGEDTGGVRRRPAEGRLAALLPLLHKV